MKGLDYFPLSCHMDDSVKLLEAEYGLEGFAVIIKLWQSVYSGEGYYKFFDSDVCLMFAKELSIGFDELNRLVNAAVNRGIFDKALYEKHKILTSKGIQSRFFKCAERRKEVSANKDFLLVDEAEFSNVCTGENQKKEKTEKSKIRKNVSNSSKNADNSKQSKVKESKVKKSKAEESKENTDFTDNPEHPPDLYGEFKNVALTKEEYGTLYSELGKEVLENYITRADEYVRISGKAYKDYFALIRKWVREDKEAKKKNKAPAKRSKFNNYEDTNKHDYSGFTEEILKEMLEG